MTVKLLNEQNLKFLSLTEAAQAVAEKSLTDKKVDKLSLERKKHEQIKRLISNMRLFLLHNTTHHCQALHQVSES